MTFFSFLMTSWRTICYHYLLSIFFDIMTYFFDFMTCVLMSWRNISILFVIMTLWQTLHTFGYCTEFVYVLAILFDVNTYFTISIMIYFLMALYFLMSYDVISMLFDGCLVIKINIMTYFWTSWRTFWHYELLVDVMKYFHNAWCRDVSFYHYVISVLFTLWHTVWWHDLLVLLYDIRFNVVTYILWFLTSWRTWPPPNPPPYFDHDIYEVLLIFNILTTWFIFYTFVVVITYSRHIMILDWVPGLGHSTFGIPA